MWVGGRYRCITDQVIVTNVEMEKGHWIDIEVIAVNSELLTIDVEDKAGLMTKHKVIAKFNGLFPSALFSHFPARSSHCQAESSTKNPEIYRILPCR